MPTAARSPTSSRGSLPAAPTAASRTRSSAATARAAGSSGTRATCPTTTTARRFSASATTSRSSSRPRSGHSSRNVWPPSARWSPAWRTRAATLLQRCQACLEMLALKVRDRPEALDLIGRLQKAQDHLHYLYEDVRSYAAPIKLEKVACDLRAGLARIVGPSRAGPQGQAGPASRDRCDGVDLRCAGDPFRLGQVFRNLLENALAAGSPPSRSRSARTRR